MKAFTKIMAVAIATVGVLTVAGCSSAKTTKTATTANWNVRTSTSVESNFSGEWQEKKEVAQYSVKFTEGVNSSYSVSYDTDGATYTTEFYMINYDWSKQSKLPEGYAPAENKVEPVYVYRTELNISGKYVHTASGDKKEFNDHVVTQCYYRLAGDNLQPVYSEQTIKNTAPNVITAVGIQDACISVDSVYTTYYDYACTKATITQQNNLVQGEPTVKEVSVASKEGYSVFDNSQLRAAVRAFTLVGGNSYTFDVLAPQNGAVQTCTAVCTSPVVLDKEDAEQKSIIDALAQSTPADYIFFEDNSTPQEGESGRNYRYCAVSMAISASMAGSSPTWWYAAIENNDVNYTKAVLLKMTTPLSFGLGTLNYTLKSLDLVTIAD